jgi:hypothetical protein
MEHLGHNHVIVNQALDGGVAYAEDLSAASFSLSIPSAAFRVDDAGMRADDANVGALHSMLSAAVLDAAQFPVWQSAALPLPTRMARLKPPSR